MKYKLLIVLFLIVNYNCSSVKKFFAPTPKTIIVNNMEKKPFDPRTEVDYYLLEFNLVESSNGYQFNIINYGDTLEISWKQPHWKHDSTNAGYPDSLIIKPIIYTYSDTVWNSDIIYETINDTSYMTVSDDINLAPGLYELYVWVQPIEPSSEHGLRSLRSFPARFTVIETIPQDIVASPMSIKYIIRKKQ